MVEKKGKAVCRLTCRKEGAWRCVWRGVCPPADTHCMFFTCRSCSYGNWKIPLCHSVPYYLAIPLVRGYISILLIKHTHTHTHLLLSLSITPSLRRALLQDFTCSEGCFLSFLDTDCLQCFFIICLHHWTLFSQHTLTLLPPGYFTVLLFTVSGTIYRKVSSSDISGWSCSC